jgi:leucyl aminopeptidase (aminopeptidase T)
MKNNYIEKYQAMTELVADYSLRLNKDDRLIIQYDPLYTDIVEIVAKTCLNKCPNIILDPLTNNAQYMRDLICANGYKQWDNELARRVFLAKWCTSRLLLDCTRTVNFDFPHASKLKTEFDRIVVGPYKKILYRPGPNSGYEVKWNIAGFPCSHSFYKYLLANKKTYRYSIFKSNAAIYNDYRDLVFDSVLGNDWVAMHTKMEQVKATFDNANNVRIIVGDGTLTDLELSLKGRGGEICSGQNNMPDGEVCYGPVEESLHGHITFQIPSERSPYGVFNTIRLQFHNGKIVDAKELTSKQKNANLNSILDIDMGAK